MRVGKLLNIEFAPGSEQGLLEIFEQKQIDKMVSSMGNEMIGDINEDRVKLYYITSTYPGSESMTTFNVERVIKRDNEHYDITVSFTGTAS